MTKSDPNQKKLKNICKRGSYRKVSFPGLNQQHQQSSQSEQKWVFSITLVPNEQTTVSSQS